MADSKVALVNGATGLVGRHIVMYLDQLNDWKIYTMGRRPLKTYTRELHNTKHIEISDLSNADSTSKELSKLGDVTHIFHCAFTTSGDEWKDQETNMAMLTNTVEAIEAIANNKLSHVYVQTGTKWYGQMIAAAGHDQYKSPAREDDPRYMTPNFYYAMEDWCAERAGSGASWTWSALRPDPVIGFSEKSFMNLVNCIGAYGTLCKVQGLPFRFPGTTQAYNSLHECCDVDLLAQGAVWTSTNKAAANQPFNISNGDVFRWCQVWPKLAKKFDLEVAPPMKTDLTKFMAYPDKTQAWDKLKKEHNLVDLPYDQAFPWYFMDYVFSLEFDDFTDVNKLRRAGFHEQNLDSAEVLCGWIDKLRDMNIIP